MAEGPMHLKAKQRMYDIVLTTNPELIEVEYVYPNPNNKTGDPKWDWRFDVYFEKDGRRVAIEVDGHIRDGEKGHSSLRSFEKREFKRQYLKTKGIELFAWPRRWISGKTQIHTEVFLEELRLKPEMGEQVQWFNT